MRSLVASVEVYESACVCMCTHTSTLHPRKRNMLEREWGEKILPIPSPNIPTSLWAFFQSRVSAPGLQWNRASQFLHISLPHSPVNLHAVRWSRQNSCTQDNICLQHKTHPKILHWPLTQAASHTEKTTKRNIRFALLLNSYKFIYCWSTVSS